MGKSRAEYMRDYRLKKREEKLKTRKLELKKIAHNSTQRSRDFRAREANSILSQTSVANPTTALPNLVISHTIARLPSLQFCPTPFTSTETACNAGSAEIQPCPADFERDKVLQEDVEQVKHVVYNSIFHQYYDCEKFNTSHDEEIFGL